MRASILATTILFAASLLLAGEEHTRLTDDDYRDRAPQVSPDGRRVSWLSRRDGAWRLVIRLFDSETERVLKPEVADRTHYAWSPDGRAVALTGRADGGEHVLHVELDTGEARDFGTGRNPSFRPDGRALAWLSRDGLHLGDPASGRVRHPVKWDSPASVDTLSWSPDGGMIAFVMNADLWLFDTHRETTRQLFDCAEQEITSGVVRDVFFATPGRIYLTRDTAGSYAHVSNNRLEYFDMAASRLVEISDANSWTVSPDGTRIVYNLGRNLYLLRTDALSAAPVKLGEGYEPAFGPESSPLVYLWREPDAWKMDLYTLDLE
jgi:dipeptidyl aminopeptidase/acylaminoacyl peptidase